MSSTVIRSVTVGSGVDLVHIPSFARQLAQRGTRLAGVFTDREWRDAHRAREAWPADSPPPTRAHASLAARWAAKEACVKAWSEALVGEPPPISEERFDWSQIEVARDRWNRPFITVHGDVRRHLPAVLAHFHSDEGDWQIRWLVSLSHDADYAIAQVQLITDCIAHK